jgi:DNA-binding LacI/PurR family transcriptional regulator
MDVTKANQKGAIFEDDVIGIISLTPFQMPVRFGDLTGTLPIVFLCPPFDRCAPKVCADVRDAYYDLTSRLIRYGHKRIVFSEDSVEPDPRQTRMHREGYLESMKEHGLAVDMDLLRDSREVRNTTLSSVATHLKAIVGMKARQRPTAVVAGSLGRGMALTRVAPLHKIGIPQDLSIVTIGSDRLEGQSGRQITGMLPDFDHMVEMCLTMLAQQKAAGKSEFTEIHVRMHFIPGDTIRFLDASAESEGVGTSHLSQAHDIQTLSQAVPC